MPGKPIFISLSTALFLFILCAGTAFAHKVNIFAYVEGGIVYTESYFPDGRAVEQGTITVLADDREKLLEGKTDEQGMFSFPVPKIADLTIILDAGMGHKNKFELKKSALGE